MARPTFDSHDYEQNHLTAAIGYLIFFVPLLANGKSALNRFCANQGLLGLIVYCAVSLVMGLIGLLLGWIPLIGSLISLIGSLLKIGVIVLLAWYAWNAYNGKAEALPYIGGIELIR